MGILSFKYKNNMLHLKCIISILLSIAPVSHTLFCCQQHCLKTIASLSRPFCLGKSQTDAETLLTLWLASWLLRQTSFWLKAWGWNNWLLLSLVSCHQPRFHPLFLAGEFLLKLYQCQQDNLTCCHIFFFLLVQFEICGMIV